MILKLFKNYTKKYTIYGIVGFLIFTLSVIPVRFTVALWRAPYPQAIFTLGGDSNREMYTAKFAKYYPDLEIWVSTGIAANQAQKIFQAAGILNHRVYLDYRAVDTVTNFTTLVEDFKKRNIHHLFLITSDFHMPRAKAIATIVFGSQGIVFTPISIPSNEPKESKLRILRDSCRSLVWIITGRTGASFKAN